MEMEKETNLQKHEYENTQRTIYEKSQIETAQYIRCRCFHPGKQEIKRRMSTRTSSKAYQGTDILNL